ncbi:hypothetical protein HpHA137_14650 [Helicobacter pylori]
MKKEKFMAAKTRAKRLAVMTSPKNCIRDYKKWDEKSLQKRYDFLYGIITPILHIEGQEEEFEEEIEEEIDLE